MDFETRETPHTVALVAMGSSRNNFESDVMKAGGAKGVADEVWVINKLGCVFNHDVVFRMDDLRTPRECNLRPGTNRDRSKTIHDTQDDWMKNHDKPIITSTAYPEFPTSISYPLENVINTLGYSYFISTPAYAAAFAIHIGVKKLKIYGCDYVYANNIYIAESGRANMEFILALGMTMGMQVEVAPSSTLLETNRHIIDHLYGYPGVIEVIESKQEGKRYEIRHRPDMTKKYHDEVNEAERKQLQALLNKHGDEVKRDLIKNGDITHKDIDDILDASKKTVQEESLKGEPNDKPTKISKGSNKRKSRKSIRAVSAT